MILCLYSDIILGGVDGTSSITDNDFNRRGEYEGGPDGCAIDFETSSSGVRVDGNTIFKSWGAGIMVFGHQTTSHNLSISNNTFLQAGCIQVFFPSFSAIFNRKMQKLPLFSCILMRNEGKNRTDTVSTAKTALRTRFLYCFPLF